MRIFSVTVNQVATGATANAFATLLGLKMADTAGHKARLRKIVVAGAGGAPQDEQVTLQLRRSDNTSDGTSSSVNVNTIGAHDNDANAAASNVAAIGKTYTSEPTTIDTALIALGSLNARGVLVREWHGDGPVWGINETLLVQGAPGQATAVNLSVSAEWEE